MIKLIFKYIRWEMKGVCQTFVSFIKNFKKPSYVLDLLLSALLLLMGVNMINKNYEFDLPMKIITGLVVVGYLWKRRASRYTTFVGEERKKYK